MPMSLATDLTDARDPRQQVAASTRIGQANQADADFDLHRVDGQVVFDALVRLLGRDRLGLRRRAGLGRHATFLLGEHDGQGAATGAQRQQRNGG